MSNGGGGQGVRYYSSVDSDEREEGGGRSYYEPIWRSSYCFGVRRTGALWWTLGLVAGCSAAIALYCNMGDRTNSKYADMVYNTGAVGGRKEHRLNDGSVQVYTSSKYSGEQQLTPLVLTSPWSEIESKSDIKSWQEEFGSGDDEIAAAITLNEEAVQQEILGFGGAVTDAAAITYYALPLNERNRLIDAYFGSEGARYSILRVPMNSCDFSVKKYSFDDVSGDCKLEFFDHEVQHEQKMRIPLIKEILKRNHDIKVFVSPWSPPAWMKEPQKDGMAATMDESAYPLGLRNNTQVHEAWAMYFSAFISAYEALGIPVWGVTVQNEPLNTGPWEACRYTARAMHLFIKNHLGPVLRRNHPNVVIMTYDHNKDCMVHWTSDLVADPDALSYVDGMAFHWYASGADRNLDGSYGWKNIEKASESLVVTHGKFLLSSECCHCPGIDTTLDGAWYRAEKTVHDIMADLANRASGWVDWNLILNHEGGPNHLGNLCDSPARASMSYNNFTFAPMYYTISHISKFVPPGSKILGSVAVGRYNATMLEKRPSGVLVGFEATLWPCERSVRQHWRLNSDGSLELLDQMTEQFELWKPVCLSGKPNNQTSALELVVCDNNKPATKWEPIATNANTTGIQLRLKGSSPPVCLGASSKKGGALAELFSCDELNVEETIWVIGDTNIGGELKHSSTGHCLTAGWPFFSSVAFSTPEGETVVVVLNEADEDVPFLVIFGRSNVQFDTSIPLKSIQTYVF